MGKKFDVYLSSTFDDLQAERKRVAEIIQTEFKWTVQDSYSASHQGVLQSSAFKVPSLCAAAASEPRRSGYGRDHACA
jgi:Domain of unknown function (DUF4062)